MNVGHGTITQHEMLHQGLADTLYRAALDLALMGERVDDRADVVSSGELAQLHLSGFAIDFDFGDLRGEGSDIDRLRIIDAVGAHRRLALRSRPSHQIRKAERPAVLAAEALLTIGQLGGWYAQARTRQFEHGLPGLLRRFVD